MASTLLDHVVLGHSGCVGTGHGGQGGHGGHGGHASRASYQLALSRADCIEVVLILVVLQFLLLQITQAGEYDGSCGQLRACALHGSRRR